MVIKKKIRQNTLQIAPFYNFFSGDMPRTPKQNTWDNIQIYQSNKNGTPCEILSDFSVVCSKSNLIDCY